LVLCHQVSLHTELPKAIGGRLFGEVDELGRVGVEACSAFEGGLGGLLRRECLIIKKVVEVSLGSIRVWPRFLSQSLTIVASASSDLRPALEIFPKYMGGQL
jgi:hypothetical protein